MSRVWLMQKLKLYFLFILIEELSALLHLPTSESRAIISLSSDASFLGGFMRPCEALLGYFPTLGPGCSLFLHLSECGGVRVCLK